MELLEGQTLKTETLFDLAIQIAEALKISPETVMRDWKMAKAWLYRELGGINSGQ